MPLGGPLVLYGTQYYPVIMCLGAQLHCLLCIIVRDGGTPPHPDNAFKENECHIVVAHEQSTKVPLARPVCGSSALWGTGSGCVGHPISEVAPHLGKGRASTPANPLVIDSCKEELMQWGRGLRTGKIVPFPLAKVMVLALTGAESHNASVGLGTAQCTHQRVELPAD